MSNHQPAKCFHVAHCLLKFFSYIFFNRIEFDVSAVIETYKETKWIR